MKGTINTNAHLIELYRKLRPLQIFNNHKISSTTSETTTTTTTNTTNTATNTATSDNKIDKHLTVLSYNLLAQHHINNEVYPYCVNGVLRASYRIGHLSAELKAYEPFDLAAFQEVFSFEETWKTQWKTQEQGVVYAQKEGGRDGLCICYNSRRFKVVSEEILSFAPLMTALEGAIPNIAQIILLHEIATNNHIILSNTHLFWRPEFDCLRVLQAHRLRKRIEEIKRNVDESCLTIMCGDWNSDPNSAVYHLISGQIDQITRSHWALIIQSHSNLLNFPMEHSQRLFNQVIEDFKKWPKLASAYANYQSPQDPNLFCEPPYTSVNSYIDTLDYIFIDPKKSSIDQLLMMPADEIVKGQTALPNEIYSSDHLALWAKFNIS